VLQRYTATAVRVSTKAAVLRRMTTSHTRVHVRQVSPAHAASQASTCICAVFRRKRHTLSLH